MSSPTRDPLRAEAEPPGDPRVRLLALDLASGQAALDAIVDGLAADAWATPTPAPGWDVHDQIAHLALVDELAVEAVTTPSAFTGTSARAADDPFRFEADLAARGRRMSPREVLLAWREHRAAVLDGVLALPDGSRIEWFGPPMSRASFLTARLMETWAHGVDVAEALGAPVEATDRLRHVADLGVRTQGWSYAVRGRAHRSVPTRVELDAPGGGTWTWGPVDAADSVRGPALDFCLVVTQRRTLGGTGLAVRGDAAAEWMALAQAFAGPPTTTTRTPREKEGAQ